MAHTLPFHPAIHNLDGCLHAFRHRFRLPQSPGPNPIFIKPGKWLMPLVISSDSVSSTARDSTAGLTPEEGGGEVRASDKDLHSVASSRTITDRRWTGGKVLAKNQSVKSVKHTTVVFLVCFSLGNSTKLKLHIYFVNRNESTCLEGRVPRYIKSF